MLRVIRMFQINKRGVGDTELLMAPLFHVGAAASLFYALILGVTVILHRNFNPHAVVDALEKYKLKALFMVPAMIQAIINTVADLDRRDFSSLKRINYGAAPIGEGLLKQALDIFGCDFQQSYGMTETGGSVSQATGEALVSRPQASGQVLPMNRVRIVDEDGKDLPAGKTGDIWVTGATLMTGYYGRQEDTKAAFEGEWLKTGDVGYLDEDDYIYIVDRKTDMVISGGENIYCVEVEAALNKHPNVLQVCTFGIPDDRLGEKLIACFVPKNDGLSSEELLAFGKANLPGYRVPKEFVCIKEPFELNAMSKIEKRKVRAGYLAGEYTDADGKA